MQLMKLSAVLATAALILAGCTNPTVANTDLANKSGISATFVDGNQKVLGNPTVAAPVALTNTTKQMITLAFNAPVDLSGTTVPGLTVYNLSNAAAASASYVRGAAIAYSAVQAQTASTTWTLTLTLDLTGASGQIEVVATAPTLTAASGLLKLDGNGNMVAGEATDDSVTYLGVTGGTAVTIGVVELPHATMVVSTTTNNLSTAGGTTILFNVTDAANGTNVDSAAIFTAANFKAQKFDYAAKAWADQSYTVSGTLPTITLTLAASVAGQSYRFVILDQTTITEKASTNGYTHSYNYGPSKFFQYNSFVVGGTPSYTDTSGYAYKKFTPTVTSTFDTNNTQGVVKLVFTGLGTAGLDPASVTASTVKLFTNQAGDATTIAAGSISWASATVTSSSPTSLNDTLCLTLPASYKKAAVVAKVQIFGLVDQGATTTGLLKAKCADLTNLTDLTATYAITGNL